MGLMDHWLGRRETHLDRVGAQLRTRLFLHLADVGVDQIVGSTHGLRGDPRGRAEAGTVVGNGSA